jgi:hypothetical protein
VGLQFILRIVEVFHSFDLAEGLLVLVVCLLCKPELFPGFLAVDHVLDVLEVCDLGVYVRALDGLRLLNLFSKFPASCGGVVVFWNESVSEVKEGDLYTISRTIRTAN